MKKVIVLCAALLAMTAATASAQLNLSWDDCGAAGNLARTFACNTNTSPLFGPNASYLVGSFVSPGLSALTGEDAYVTVESGVPNLPQWWHITNYTGTVPGCRSNAVLVTTFGDGTGLATCADYFGTKSGTGGTDYILGPTSNKATIRPLGAVPSNLAAPLAAGSENYAFTIRITNALTTGAGACTGCTDGVTLTFDHLLLTQPVGVGDITLTGSPAGGRNFCNWNGGVTPTATKSWGQIKALYR